MMQDFQNALYINDVDPSNAVIFDREWLRRRSETPGSRSTRRCSRASADISGSF